MLWAHSVICIGISCTGRNPWPFPVTTGGCLRPVPLPSQLCPSLEKRAAEGDKGQQGKPWALTLITSCSLCAGIKPS